MVVFELWFIINRTRGGITYGLSINLDYNYNTFGCSEIKKIITEPMSSGYSLLIVITLYIIKYTISIKNTFIFSCDFKFS